MKLPRIRRLITIALIAAMLVPAAALPVRADYYKPSDEVIVLEGDMSYQCDVSGGFNLNGHNLVIVGNFEQTLPVTLNGGTLTVLGNYYCLNDISGSAGSIHTDGSFEQRAGSIVLDGSAEISADGALTQGNVITLKGNSRLTTGGDYSHNATMTLKNNAQMTVGGNYTQTSSALSLASTSSFTVKGSYTQLHDFNLNGSTFTVKGAYNHRAGVLTLNNGTLDAEGGYYMTDYTQDAETGDYIQQSANATLQMNHENDTFICGTEFFINSQWGSGSSYNDISDGTLILKGDFHQTGSPSCFAATNNHKVKFSGASLQRVTFDSTNSGFNILLPGENENVEIYGTVNTLHSDVTLKKFEQEGSLDLAGHNLTVRNNFTQSSNINLNKGTLTVSGNYLHTEGTLNFSEGRLNVMGDYRLQNYAKDEHGNVVFVNGSPTFTVSSGTVYMTNDDDYFFVGGNCYIQSVWGSGPSYNYLNAGTLELQGNFYESGDGGNFYCQGDHKVKFSGDTRQIINFENTGSGFNILQNGGNANVAITNGRIRSISEDVTLDSLVQYGSGDNGFYTGNNTLTVRSDLVQNGDITINGGKITVGGSYIHNNRYLVFDSGSLEVDRDFRLQSKSLDENNQIVYGYSEGAVQMTNPDDYFLVKGNCYIQSVWGNGTSYNQYTDGLLELKGNFYESGNGGNFYCQGSHAVMFSGTDTQTIHFENTGSGFNLLKDGGNSDVIITNGRFRGLAENVTVKSILLYGSGDNGFQTNGYTFTVQEDFVEKADVTINGGKIAVGGDYIHKDRYLTFNGGTLEVGGDFRLQTVSVNEQGQKVYGSSDGVIQMTHADDYFLVNGSCYIQSVWGNGASYNQYTDGLIELKGNFYESGDGGNFYCQNNHKVKFSGDNRQIINFTNKGSGFNILMNGGNPNVAITNGRIRSLGEDVTVDSFVQYGTGGNKFNTNEHVLTVNSNFVQTGDVTINGGEIAVTGTYTHTDGSLRFDNGTLDVSGNFRLQNESLNEQGQTEYSASNGTIQMTHAGDTFIVGGDCYIQSVWGNGPYYNLLTDGTLVLKGNFYESGDGSNFYCQGEHKVKFSGSERQIINFANGGSGFNILMNGGNTNVAITKGRISKIGENVTIDSFVQNGSLDLNGKTFTINAEMVQNGSVDLNSGNFIVKKNYTQQDGTLNFNKGKLEVRGAYLLRKATVNANGKITYSNSNGVIRMTNESDYFHVKGNFYAFSVWGRGTSYNDLTNGTLELEGNFTQSGSDSSFCAYENHKVKFTGSKTQTVKFTSSNSSFGTIIPGTNTAVDITYGRIRKVGGNVTVNSFKQCGELDVNGYTFTILNDLVETGSIYVNSGKLTVKGNLLHTSGALDINNGRIDVFGDYRLQSVSTDENGETVYGASDGVLKMNDAKDILSVRGDYYAFSTWGSGSAYNNITNGILELRGDFTQGGSGSSFCATDNHKVKFTGTKTQNITFTSTNSCFNILNTGTNEDVNITGTVRKIGSNAVLKSFNQYGNLDINGKTLTVTEDLTENGSISINSGELFVGGNYIHQNGALDLNDGSVYVEGDYRLQTVTIGENNEKTYSSSNGVLKMNNADDYFLVKGGFFTQSAYGSGASYNDLTNGILELRGAFSQINGSGSNFNATGSHVTILSGDSIQPISFANPRSSHFNILFFKNYQLADYYPDGTSYPFAYYADSDVAVNTSRLLNDRVVVGTPFNLKMSSVGGTGAKQYAVYYKLRGTSDYQVLQDYTENTDLSLVINEVGEYDLRLFVKYNGDKTAVKDCRITIAKPLENTSYIVDELVKPGNPIKIKCAAEGGSGDYQYIIHYKKSTETAYTKLTDFTANTNFNIPTSEECYMDVVIKVKDSFGTIVREQFRVRVADIFESTATVSSETAEPGETLTITASVLGGTSPFTHSFLYKLPGSSSWKTLQGFSDADTAEFTPTTEGDYEFCVKSKDSTDRQCKKYITVTVVKKIAPLANNSTLSASAANAGEEITVHCAATGGTDPYTYNVLYKKPGATSWTTLQAFGSNSDVAFTPTLTGEYSICIKAKDSSGTLEKVYLPLTVSAALANTSTLSASAVEVNKAITVRCSASGGKAPYTYNVLVKKPGTTSWTTLQAFSSNSDVTYTPAATGDYSICIKAKDSSGAIEKVYLPLTVSASFTNTSALSVSSVAVNNAITVNCSVTGGKAPYTYNVLVKKPGSTSWTTLQSFGPNTTVSYTPNLTGEYSFCVKAKDSDGKLEKVYLPLTVTASSELVNTSTVSASSAKIGSSVTLKASAEGGKSPYTFAFYYKKSTESSYTTLKNFSTTASVAFKPTDAAKYDIVIKVKDADKTIVRKELTVTFTA